MTRKTKHLVRALADHYRLRIKYVSDLPAKVPGFLDPSRASRTIVVNANKSKSDHAFTILHEIAHYILHYERSHRIRVPWYLARRWKSDAMSRFSNKTKWILCRKRHIEWQADLWAFCALLQIGATNEVLAIVSQYPEKSSTFWLSFAACIYSGVKFRLKQAFQVFFRPIW